MVAESHAGARCDCARPNTCVDRHRGRYLTAVLLVTLDRDGRVRTGEVSDRLGVSPASVTEMFERLATDGLVDYEKHRGVELTRRGTEIARELIRRQCVVRTFFDAELDVSLPVETGYRMGYVLSDVGIERLRERAGPRFDDCEARVHECHSDRR
jgi:Mn-dependent DtxR family transcriptional regulator